MRSEFGIPLLPEAFWIARIHPPIRLWGHRHELGLAIIA
jgi:hypothetical protein